MVIQKVVNDIARLQESKEETTRKISKTQQQRSTLTLELTGAPNASNSKQLPIGLRGLDREHRKMVKLQKQFNDLRLVVNPQLASIEIRKIEELELPPRNQGDKRSKQ